MGARQPNDSFPFRDSPARGYETEERKRMRDYELTIVIRILPSDEEVNQAIDQVIQTIELGENGVVKSVDRKLFGRRRLAYEIDGQREGHYVFIKADIQPEHLPELETELKLADAVLRYLLVREEGEVKAQA